MNNVVDVVIARKNDFVQDLLPVRLRKNHAGTRFVLSRIASGIVVEHLNPVLRVIGILDHEQVSSNVGSYRVLTLRQRCAVDCETKRHVDRQSWI